MNCAAAMLLSGGGGLSIYIHFTPSLLKSHYINARLAPLSELHGRRQTRDDDDKRSSVLLLLLPSRAEEEAVVVMMMRINERLSRYGKI